MADSVTFIWMEVQPMGSQLESVFTVSKGMRSQLPEDVNRIDEISRGFKVSRVSGFVHYILHFSYLEWVIKYFFNQTIL